VCAQHEVDKQPYSEARATSWQGSGRLAPQEKSQSKPKLRSHFCMIFPLAAAAEHL